MVRPLFALGVCLDKTETKVATETNLWKLDIVNIMLILFIVTWFYCLGFIFPYGFKG